MPHDQSRGRIKREEVCSRLGGIGHGSVVGLFISVQVFQQGFGRIGTGGGLLFQKVCAAHVCGLSVGEGAAGHAKGILFFVRMVERLHKLCAQHDCIHTVRGTDDMGIAGKREPVEDAAIFGLSVPGIHQVYSFYGIAGDHRIILLQVLHASGKGVVVAVRILLPDLGDDAELCGSGIVLDPALFEVVAPPGRQILCHGSRVGVHDAVAFLVVFVRVVGVVFPPHELVVPLRFFHGVLVAHRVDAGEKVVCVGFFGQIQKVHTILDVLVHLPLRFHRLIAVVEHVVACGSIEGAVGVTAKDLQHQLVDDIPNAAVVLAHAIFVRVSKVHLQVTQRGSDGAQLKTPHLVLHLLVVGIHNVLQELL